jgi:hypothetical protein
MRQHHRDGNLRDLPNRMYEFVRAEQERFGGNEYAAASALVCKFAKVSRTPALVQMAAAGAPAGR